jgi:opacity protein-like surface antigen
MRKKIFLLMVVVLCFTGFENATAQLKKGQMELSLSAAFMGVQDRGGDFSSAFNLSTRFGYFLSKEFEVEPEIIFSSYGGSGNPGIILSGNFLYNYHILDRLQISPFFLAGFGWANSRHYFNLMNFGEENRNYTILNLGVGLKSFISKSVSLRMEYRFQRFIAGEEKVEPVSFWMTPYTYDPSLSYHNFMMGLSVFLK